MFKLEIILVFLIGTTLILWAFLVRWHTLSTIGLKRLEYVCLVFASIGLVSITADVKRMIDTNELNIDIKRAEVTYDNALKFMGEGHPGYVCRPFQRTELSPPTFDSLVIEYDRACRWYGTVFSKMPKSAMPDIASIRVAWVEPDFKDKVLLDSVSTIKEYLNRYENELMSIEEQKEAISRSDLETTLFVFSPYFVAFSLALAFVKVAGEIEREKGHNKPPS